MTPQQEFRQVKEFSNELCMQCGLSITEAKSDPFHIPEWKKKLQKDIREAMETVHHSEEEIERILRHSGKIDRTVEYAVDDEDTEYEQYHGSE